MLERWWASPRTGRGSVSARKALLVALAAATALASPGRAALLTLSGSTLTIAPFLHSPFERPVLAQDPASIPVFVASSGGFDEPASVFGPDSVLHTAMFTAVPLLIQGIGVVSAVNRTKTITCAGGACGGPGPLDGRLSINVLGLFNLEVPLDPVGSPGASAQAVAGSLFLTIFGNDWTTGSQVITGITTDTLPFGQAINTVTFSGSDARTPGHRGTLRLISAFKVVTNAVGNLPGVAIQTLTFTGALPEPSTLLLLASGVAALALHARRRRRR
jgi:hypothetical protein